MVIGLTACGGSGTSETTAAPQAGTTAAETKAEETTTKAASNTAGGYELALVTDLGTTDAYLETIGLAIEGGAKLVVCPGFLFEEPIFLAQDLYPDISFILLDGEPHSGDFSQYKTNFQFCI